MNDIEREVREMLAAKSRRAPAMEELPPPVLGRARARRIRNGIAGGAVLGAVVVAAVIGGRLFTTAETVEPIGGGIVPWIDAAPLAFDAPLDQIPLCRAQDLRFIAVSGPRATLRIDSGNARCFTADYRVTVLDPAGELLPVRIEAGARWTVSPGESDRLFGDWSPCVPVGPLTFRIAFDGGRGTLAAVAVEDASVERCGAGDVPSSLRLMELKSDYRPLDEARELLRGLKVSVDAPETVRSGSTLAYRVTLTNTTTSPIPLDICPMYTQALRVGEVGSATPATHFLNCAAVGGSIPAGKSVTFEMRYLVDEGLNPAEGQWRVQWGFEGGLDLPYGSSPVVLEPAA